MNLIEKFRDEPTARSLKQGHVILHQGEPGHVMYVLLEGHVEINVRGQLMDIIGPGGFFGEMALIDKTPRLASAVARTDCKVVALDETQFLRLIKSEPAFALEVMKTLSHRLRREVQLHSPA